MKNKTILQYFEWYLPSDGNFWKNTARDAAHLARLGFTDIWLPPAYKGHVGMEDVGYGVYDLYDLGEFDQKGSVATKYGTKDEYLAAIKALQAEGMQVIGDIVLNHRMGGDGYEITTGSQMHPENRMKVKRPRKMLKVQTRFTFPGRNGKYSTFTWNKSHFNGIDRNALLHTEGIFKLLPNRWNPRVSKEKKNFDYLMGCNHDMTNPAVTKELTDWGKWYMDFTGLDGVRLDAVKHIDYEFFPKWLRAIREHKGRDVFAVGEYWWPGVDELTEYLYNCQHCMALFDVPLHHNFHDAAKKRKKYNLTRILDNSLVSREPEYAVTFVDNHDTEPRQALQSWVKRWFKPLAYAIILLRKEGTPCVFFGDLYGVPKFNIGPVPKLDRLLMARQRFAYGDQRNWVKNEHVVGWTRGDSLAVLMSNDNADSHTMTIGRPGQVFVDLMGNREEKVVIGDDGNGLFFVDARSVSVWVPQDQLDL